MNLSQSLGSLFWPELYSPISPSYLQPDINRKCFCFCNKKRIAIPFARTHSGRYGVALCRPPGRRPFPVPRMKFGSVGRRLGFASNSTEFKARGSSQCPKPEYLSKRRGRVSASEFAVSRAESAAKVSVPSLKVHRYLFTCVCTQCNPRDNYQITHDCAQRYFLANV